MFGLFERKKFVPWARTFLLQMERCLPPKEGAHHVFYVRDGELLLELNCAGVEVRIPCKQLEGDPHRIASLMLDEVIIALGEESKCRS